MLGRYRLVQRLAQGGMATVYLARQEGPGGFERPVAIKVVHAHLAREPRFATMFLDEARLTGRLHHPNVCAVVDFGEDAAQLYLAMEYLHGETFASVIRRGARDGGALPPAIVARILADAARGLHAAHELRDAEGHPLEIVHRDVSPQNLIVLYDGHTKLTDFGIARARGRLTDTTTGELKGKISFMSPEQLQSAPIDRRTDVWALGVVAWEALCGRRLFRADSEGATALNVIAQEIARPSSVAPDVPEALDAIVLRALERDVSRRTPTAAQLADELEEYLYARGRPLGAPEIASWMEAHFEDRIRKRAGALQGRRSAMPLDRLSAESLDRASDDDAKTTPHDAAPPIEPTVAQEASEVRLTGFVTTWWRRSRWRVALALIAIGAVMGVSIALVLPPRESPAPPRTIPAEARPASVPPPMPSTPPPAPPSTPIVAAPTEETPPRRATRERARDTAPRATGRINLLAIPQAEVFLRGRSLGRTPLVERELPAGAHTLELREVGGARRERVRVEIRPGERTDRSVRFE
ncbi:Serine/threonine protein kinase PrkC, regulator of stationary phase [Sandaracinus amylolyticus]|uniref:Serine/threonine protein kinase PrkC, regulator of stationary phase n=2 Tax=Sandaracinus amylolyticus TaxID=927083 RepID=A0A0F6SD91_9BACT|nr:Serine/threonine protein kinase PrkC, regulator of stationary phase [Sandaracinus amylolyticus]